ADWIIDLGPGAGHDGGRIVFEGTPADLVAARCTLTGEHLAAYAGT
ncbi:MAG: excinuclease ABC, A subunit, partial [Solirubrobacteraceae bacterium]